MFHFVKRALGSIACLLITTCPACAFTLSYGSLFDVPDVQVRDKIIRLPLTQKKYRNVKVLSREVYQFLKQCEQDCQYWPSGDTFDITDLRRARTHEHMLIAAVAINRDIEITFLVFKNKDGFSVKTPDVVQFKDERLQREIEKALVERAGQIL